MRCLKFSWSVVVAFAICGGVAEQCAAGQERFRLTVPTDPTATSVAVLSERELIVTDAAGTSFRYAREPRFDTADGRFAGFYNATTQQPLRWPVLGQGSMQLGDPSGQTWRASQQQIQAVGVGGLPVIQPRPAMPLGAAGAVVPGHDPHAFAGLRTHGRPGGFEAGPMHVAFGANRRGRPWLATIDTVGIVQVFDATPDGWRHSGEIRGLALIPGAPLGLTADITPGQPRVYTVAVDSSLVDLTRDQGPQPVLPGTQFPPGAAISLAATDPVRDAFAVDVSGQLWSLQLATQGHQVVKSDRPFVPGSACASSHMSTRAAVCPTRCS